MAYPIKAIMCSLIYVTLHHHNTIAAAQLLPNIPSNDSTTYTPHCTVKHNKNDYERFAICDNVLDVFPNISDPYVTSLECRNCTIKNYTTSTFPYKFDRLSNINVSWSKIESLGPYAFQMLTMWSHVDLSHNNLTFIPSKALASASMAVLNLAYNSMEELPDFSDVPNLSRLYINNNYIQMLHYDSFSGFNKLRSLELQNNNISSLPLGIFRRLRFLEDLNLSNNGLTSLPMGVFSGLASLSTLNLANNPLKSFSGDELLPLNQLTFLGIGGIDARQIDPSGLYENCPTLKRLSIEGNFLYCETVKRFIRFFKSKGATMQTQNGVYNLQNIDGIPCVKAIYGYQNIDSKIFMKMVRDETH